MGNSDLKAMADGRMDPSGRDLTLGGKICGIIGVVLFAVGIVIGLFMLILGGGIAFLGVREASKATPPETIKVPQQVIEHFIAR
jgi:hypothetical protein